MSIKAYPGHRHASHRRRRSLWYRDAVLYELPVASFFDRNDDGVGDFRGLTEKLAYLQDLGVTGICLLPFYPSPMKSDGYDVAEFTSIHPDLGSSEDFHHFLMAAHHRDLRVILELVLSQTSHLHPWFERARRAPPGSRWRNFYVWSDSPEHYGAAQIAADGEEGASWAWDPTANAYFWHHLHPKLPALNYDSVDVREAMLQVVDFWLELGVDGLRLETLSSLFLREGAPGGDVPETHAFLRTLRQHIDRKFKERVLIAEVDRWPSDASAFFGNGDECQMVFCFPFLGRLLAAIEKEDRFPIMDVLQWIPPAPESCDWALSLRDADDLSLARLDNLHAVSKHEEQDNIDGGRQRAPRRRLAPLLTNDLRRIQLVNGLLYSLSGTPVLYYGDEIGMGDNVHLGERNAVRTPMQWNADRNAGFSRLDAQHMLLLPIVTDPEYQHEVVNVETQTGNPNSLLNWTKNLIVRRKGSRALSRGSLEFLFPKGEQVLSFIRRYRNDRVLVVANLSASVQAVELDLSKESGATPVELFSGDPFPPIHEAPYLLTLGPYAFYWLDLKH